MFSTDVPLYRGARGVLIIYELRYSIYDIKIWKHAYLNQS